MRDSEIKTLFAKADEQVHVDEIRKQKTYYAIIEEMEKQRTPMMSTKNILLHQNRQILSLPKASAYCRAAQPELKAAPR